MILSQLFPEDAGDLLALTEEASASSCWAGIHYPIDDDAARLMGRDVGHLVTNAARQDGAG